MRDRMTEEGKNKGTRENVRKEGGETNMNQRKKKKAKARREGTSIDVMTGG